VRTPHNTAQHNTNTHPAPRGHRDKGKARGKPEAKRRKPGNAEGTRAKTWARAERGLVVHQKPSNRKKETRRRTKRRQGVAACAGRPFARVERELWVANRLEIVSTCKMAFLPWNCLRLPGSGYRLKPRRTSSSSTLRDPAVLGDDAHTPIGRRADGEADPIIVVATRAEELLRAL
jgi:hypothetical protein